MLDVAVIGVGYLGRFHAQKYASIPGVNLKFVCDVAEKRGKEVAKETGAEFISDYRDALHEIQAASVVVPTNLHYQVGKALLDHGIHCLIEKPITTNTEEARELIEIARSKGCILQVGHLERFNPAIKFLYKNLRNPLFIEAHRLSGFKERALDVDVILDLMIHDIDLTLSFIRSPIKEIRAVGVPVLSDKIDIANARIMFENGANANLTASRISLNAMRRMRIFQPGLYLSADCSKQENLMVTADLSRPPSMAAIVPNMVKHEKRDILYDEIMAFIQCVHTNQPPFVSGEEGLKALEVAQSVISAIDQGISQYMKKQK